MSTYKILKFACAILKILILQTFQISNKNVTTYTTLKFEMCMLNFVHNQKFPPFCILHMQPSAMLLLFFFFLP